LSCGDALPLFDDRVSRLRATWLRRFGWYPGDWAWGALLLLPLAVAGAAGAIVLANHRNPEGQSYAVATAGVTISPAAAEAATPGAAPLPTPPEPGATGTTGKSSLIRWPAGRRGWTVVLVSFPQAGGEAAAEQAAEQAAKAGIAKVGVLDSSVYPSLQPGYYVVFSGVYGSEQDADTAAASVRQSGFGGAYSRQIAR
jgi:hypothetical protein